MSQSLRESVEPKDPTRPSPEHTVLFEDEMAQQKVHLSEECVPDIFIRHHQYNDLTANDE